MLFELEKVINNNELSTVFQPIVSLANGELLGYEALTRGPIGSHYQNPEVLFDAAKKYDLLWELEIICRSNAIRSFSSFGSDHLLFVNVDPYVLKDKHFIKGFTKEILTEYKINPATVVFEITEKSSIDDYVNFKETMENYKNQGYKIAIDDVGTGFSGLTTIAETRPLYIKIDMGLIAGINKDNFKKAIIKALVEFANSTNTKLIAEGIEEINDLNTLIEMGVHYGQGYFISRPHPMLPEIPAEVKNAIVNKNECIKKYKFNSCANVSIGEFTVFKESKTPDTLCSKIYDEFNKNPDLKGIPIVDSSNSVVGIMMRPNLLSKVGTQYGWSIYMRRPVQLIMDTNPLVVDYDTPLDIVSKIVVAREDDKLYDYIIVEKNNKYFGIVPVITLLEKTTELELNLAKYSNPLTGLPGNVVIENLINRKLDHDEEFSLLYFDLNDFKSYNDTYGFEKGDRIITFTSEIIQKYIGMYEEAFLGHIGGDDFVAIIPEKDVNVACERILANFDVNISDFYSEHDKANGYINAINRNNIMEQYPIMSLSIAVVTNRNGFYTNIFDITEVAARIKKKCKIEAKKKLRSCYIMNMDHMNSMDNVDRRGSVDRRSSTDRRGNVDRLDNVDLGEDAGRLDNVDHRGNQSRVDNVDDMFNDGKVNYVVGIDNCSRVDHIDRLAKIDNAS